MVVEFKQLVGERAGLRGTVEVIKHPVDEIIIDGECIGQIGRRPGADVAYYSRYTDEEMKGHMEAIIAASLTHPERKDWPPNGTAQYPPSQQQIQDGIKAILEQEAEDDEEDEEADFVEE